MSVNLLQHPSKLNTLTDDLEPFLHVLGWMTLRYVPAIHSYSALRRGKDMVMVDEHDREEDHSKQGGHLKPCVLRADWYPSSTYRPRSETPLLKLVQDLSKPFKSLYSKPPTDEERDKANVPFNRSNREFLRLCAAIDLYDQDMKYLESSTWFIDTVGTALDEKKWPIDDHADENDPGVSSNDTEGLAQNKNSQLQNTRSVWERSNGLSRGLKRAASPTPEPSAKRRRGTLVASGPGV